MLAWSELARSPLHIHSRVKDNGFRVVNIDLNDLANQA